jgi:hypothetical protein
MKMDLEVMYKTDIEVRDRELEDLRKRDSSSDTLRMQTKQSEEGESWLSLGVWFYSFVCFLFLSFWMTIETTETQKEEELRLSQGRLSSLEERTRELRVMNEKLERQRMAILSFKIVPIMLCSLWSPIVYSAHIHVDFLFGFQ